ncbi:uncharacterized protein LOC105191988 isoform X2 [Harpegnathos saltator]|uniref:uncharacterized protein LOC105191988 isoform X2 n=1 Tax=Harpegnathos saltator TaxID=610380 RepID=UPI00059118A5|nr:uncharacterized protein LOC105191988 isoform X2 [Harpegnathos saltator]
MHEVNLKSSAYNPTGQNYFEQLAAYNSMSQHLRRILLAKSVIDTRNKSYMCRRSKRSKPAAERRIYSLPEMTDDIIDRLAYDTRHHPMDILRMKSNGECLGCFSRDVDHRQSRNCGRPCCKANSQVFRRQRLTSRSQRSASPTAASKRKKFISNAIYEKECKTARKSLYAADSSANFPQRSFSFLRPRRERKFKDETDTVFVPCTTATLDPTRVKTTCHSPTREVIDRRSVSSRTSRSHDDSHHDDKVVERLACQREDEKKYINFVYDITREIMQGGLYTDKELQDVFKKHLDKNKGILSMNRMLYEIYQLKSSLNIPDEESDMDEELEDLIHAQKLLHISEIRPPTPPKVLNDNKVMEKLQAYQQAMDAQDRQPSNAAGKTVVLVDANPELLVTERDVLISLMEAGIDPKQAQYVCKSLFYKSKDTILDETIQVEAEVSHLSVSQPASYESRDGDRQTSHAVPMAESICYSVENGPVVGTVEQEAGPSASDLVATQEETVETVQSEAEASYSSDSQFEKSEGSPNDDRQTSPTGETAESSSANSAKDDDSASPSGKQEAASSTSNLVSTQDETIETENSESQTVSDGLKIRSSSLQGEE